MGSFNEIAMQLAPGVKRLLLSPGKLRLVLPWGIPYEAFGPQGVVKAWHILRLVESGRTLSMRRFPGHFPGDPFLKMDSMDTDVSHFAVSSRLTIAKEMYNVSVPKTPLTLEMELVYVGKSSQNVCTTVVLPSQRLTLAACELQMVGVDRKTHRPAPFPAWWREEFGEFSDPERQLKVSIKEAPQFTDPSSQSRNGTNVSPAPEMASLQKSQHQLIKGYDPPLSEAGGILEIDQDAPISVITFDVQVASSDTDLNRHANWASFLKYCCDALLMVRGSGVRTRQPSVAIKSADMSFVRQASVEQRITVKLWKDAIVPRALHFNIVDTDSDQLITYVFVQLYSPQELGLPVAKL